MRLFDYARASALMQEAGIELILVNSINNVTYLLDYYSHFIYNSSWLLDDGSMFYQSFVGLPVDEKQTPFFTPWVGEGGFFSENEPWVKERYFYGRKMPIPGVEISNEGQVVDPVEAAVSAIKDRNLASACIGVEFNSLPAATYKKLCSALPLVRFTDVGNLLSRLRSIKSSEEIRRMKIAGNITEQAIKTAYDSVCEGTTELEFENNLKISLAEKGAKFVWAHVAFGPKGASDIVPRDETARPGEALRVDMGGSYAGYICDMSRVGVLGNPDLELENAMAATYETYKAVRRAVKAEVCAGDLHELGTQVMKSNGYQLFSFMVGHGIGRDAHEWPFLVKGSNIILEKGMTLCIEIPLRIQGLGSINIEDMVQVTENGCESITTSCPKLYHIQ